jgi:hypothetical protein
MWILLKALLLPAPLGITMWIHSPCGYNSSISRPYHLISSHAHLYRRSLTSGLLMHGCSSGLFFYGLITWTIVRIRISKYNTVKPVGADLPEICISSVCGANIS